MHPNIVQELGVSDCGAELVLQSGFVTLLKLSFRLAGHLLRVPSPGGALEKTALGWAGTKRRSLSWLRSLSVPGTERKSIVSGVIDKTDRGEAVE